MLILKNLSFRKSSGANSVHHCGGHRHQEMIDLREQIDETSLGQFWDQVVDDLHKDPEWFTFADD